MYVCYRSVIWCHKNWMLVILFDWWSGLVILGNSHTHTHTHTHTHWLTHTHSLLFILCYLLICRQSFREVLDIDLQKHGSLIDERTRAELQETWAILSYTHLLLLTHPPTRLFSDSYFQLSCICWHSKSYRNRTRKRGETRTTVSK